MTVFNFDAHAGKTITGFDVDVDILALNAAGSARGVTFNLNGDVVITIGGKSVMLQAVSIYAKPTEWSIEEMLPIMIDVSITSLRILGLTE